MNKRSAYFFGKDVLNFVREIRLQLVENILPKNYYIQQNADFNTRLNYFPEFICDAGIYNRNEKYRSTRDANRILQLRLLLLLADKNCTMGDYAEIGTFRGNFARFIYKYKARDSQLYCFDTFEGFDSRDIGVEMHLKTLKDTPGDFSGTSVPKVYKAIGAATDQSDLILRKGYFPATYAGLENKKWRFVHLDVDLYEPTINALRIFWPALVAGGILLIHDYNGHYRGVSKAVDDYFDPLGIPVVPVGDKVGSAVVVKSRPISKMIPDDFGTPK